ERPDHRRAARARAAARLPHRRDRRRAPSSHRRPPDRRQILGDPSRAVRPPTAPAPACPGGAASARLVRVRVTRRLPAFLRATTALALAGLSLLCALVAARGPADHLRTRYTWPPPTLPAARGVGLWYTPLLLTRHVPESISAEIPCSPPAVLPGSTRTAPILATARDWAATGALAVTRAGNGLRIDVGSTTLATVP